MTANGFFADDKFECVIRELLGAGWHQFATYPMPEENFVVSTPSAPSDTASSSSCFPSSECRLIWTNLAKVDWSLLRHDQIINHMRGSQHLSNKAFLAYHMDTSGYSRDMPPQWSAAYQDLASLISLVALNELLLLSIEKEGEIEIARLNELRDVFRALGMDQEWAKGSDACIATELLSLLLKKQQLQQSSSTTSTSDATLLLDAVVARVNENQPYRRWGGTENIWIVKPVGLSCGEKIQVVQGLRGVLGAALSLDYKCVVQKYIERPLLVRGGRKFDIRQWVLVTSIDPFIIYGFSEFYCRLSSHSYQTTAESLLDPTIHLCNHAIQKNVSFNFSESADESVNRSSSSGDDVYCETMMTQAQFSRELSATQRQGEGLGDGARLLEDVILPQVKRIALHTVSCVKDRLEKRGGGFEWLGLDLMVTESAEVLLVECNVSPDISPSTPVTSRLVAGGVRDLFALLLEHEAIACF